MALQPIDLQAIFSQIDKVAKTQAMQRDGQQIQESIQQAQAQKKLEENIQSVNESQHLGEESGKIKDENRREADHSGSRGKAEKEDDSVPEEKKTDSLIRDPALGRNIDISG